MRFIDRVRSLFMRGGAKIGMVETLNTILDHPKINGDKKEYARINQSLMYYEGSYPKIKYKNSNNIMMERYPSTINMMKKVANQYATLVFNEQCEITVGEEVKKDDQVTHTNKKAADFIQGVFEHNDFKKNFSKYLEPMFALGGLACRPYLDANTDQIEFSWALADAFYPLESNTNNISECAIPFTTTRIEGKKTIYYTLLEFHEWENGQYFVRNELYRSEKEDVVGVSVPLSELYEDLEEETSFNNLSRPIFAYLKPSGFNNINPYSPLGLGVCDNTKHTLERVNRTYDEFDQEIKRGKRRVAVSEMLMKSRTDRETGVVTQFFDDDEDVFQIIPGASMDDMSIHDLSNDIRTSEYVTAINYHLKTLEMETGLSAGTFTFDANGVRSTKTATEVVSENSQTYQTRAMQITEVEKFIKELVVSVCELGKALKVYDGDIPKFEEIGVSFDDGAFQDKDAQLAFYMKLVTLGYPVEKVFEKVLKLPEDEALKLLQSGLRQETTRTTGIFNNMGLLEELE